MEKNFESLQNQTNDTSFLFSDNEDNPFEDQLDINTFFFVNDSRSQSFSPPIDFTVHHAVLAVLLGIMCLCVIFGNILVMVAIRRERYLQTVTNYFVASLAAADCLVGLVVMPFSVVHEVMNKSWIFGQDWCDLWHSFDVLASTASILNLCVISMDRYWAITDPLSYPAKLTSKRAKILIAVVWTCSSLISFPAILWWRATVTEDPPEYSCLFTEDIGYLVFSSIISFYGPLTVMLYVYYRIYRAATEQTRSIKLGSKNVCMKGGHKTTGETNNSSLNSPGGRPGGCYDDNGPVVLRIHRGGFTSLNQAMQQQINDGDVGNSSSRDTTPSSSGKSISRFSKFFKKKPTTASGDNNNIANTGNSCLLKLPASRTPSNPPEDLLPQTLGQSSSANSNSATTTNKIPSSTKSSMDTARAQRNLKAWSMGKKFSKLAKEKKAAKTLGKMYSF